MRKSTRAMATAMAYESGYRVDDDGNVISPRGTTRKPQYDGRGYYRFTFRKGDLQTTVNYHQLCAFQKFGSRALAEGVHIRHLDGNSRNNRPSNIGIGSQSDNMMDVSREVRLSKARKAAAKQRKLSDGQVAQLKKEREGGASLKVLSQRYGLAKSTVSYIVNGKTYSPGKS